jgi:hypothetical protein
MEIVSFADLPVANLHVDAVYQGSRNGNAGDDPFPKLLNVSNQGGFRYRGRLNALELVVLTSSLADPDWPDSLDRETGTFTYYGDNKRPGRALHATPRNGNELLRRVFDLSHQGREGRSQVPPIFVFSNTGTWRDVVFLGLAVPGTTDLRASEDLVAIWRSAGGKRFQNYRARLTVLNVPVVQRTWLDDIRRRQPHSPNAPEAWVKWVETGQFDSLAAPRSLEHRTKREQLPDREGRDLVSAIHAFFADRPHEFEACAGALARMLLPDIASLDLTRPSRDGGRDAIGQFKIGRGGMSVLVDFALEAKCYGPGNAVGVREMSRLISRLRHRQFGVLVTTSYVDSQTYREIKEDAHPIVVICAADIVDLLRLNGLGEVGSLSSWLQREFSASG